MAVIATRGTDHDLFCAGQRAVFNPQGAPPQIQAAAQYELIVHRVQLGVRPADRDQAVMNLAVEHPADIDVIGADLAIIDQQVAALITADVNVPGVGQ